ncbi:MAG: SpoIIE family protein phosphatase [Fuerstia sp.]|nr:SpoIIE family protein phosphatase [Fuerstiella sp.]
MADLCDIRRNQKFPLHGVLTVIGRDPGCDIVVDSPVVSARHFIILNRKGAYSLEDLGSMNGTFVNGHRLARRTRIFSGDCISVVGLTLVFQAEESPGRGGVSSGKNGAIGITMGDSPEVSTIPLSELQNAPRVKEITSLEIEGDLRLSVKPEVKLRAVLEIARNLSHSLDLKIVGPQIMDSLFAIFPAADCGFILLRDQQSGAMTPCASKYRRPRDSDSLPVSRSIIQQVLVSGRAILSRDAAIDTQIKPTDSIHHLDIRSIMCVPINREDGDCMGVIQLDSRDRTSQFNEEDLALLVCASLLAARAMEVARLHEERQEMEAATRIQRSLLPTVRPSYAGLEFFDYYAPAQRVSGDYFDYIRLPGNRLAVVIGDVVGKGMSAALLMAHLSAATRICLSSSPTLTDAVRQLNRLLLNSISDDRFITFVVAVLALDEFRLTVINAGHPPPLLRRGNRNPVELEDFAGEMAGLPLGVRDLPYQQVETTFEPGDTLLLFTDGATEMRDHSGKLYGMDRLHATVLAAAGDPEGTVKALLQDLQQFAQSRPAGDDLTFVSLGRTV